MKAIQGRPIETLKTILVAGFIGVGFGHWIIPTHDLGAAPTAAQAASAASPTSSTPHP